MIRTIVCTGAAALAGAGLASAQGVCPGEGPCFQSHPGFGCNDASCCIAICAQDPFCCDVQWDGFCANQAVAQCTAPCPGQCDGDLNDNGNVGGADLGLLLANWGKAGCGDLNVDGIVNGADLGLLLSAWGACFACGDPGAGSCCSAHDNPFCDDAGCCQLVCSQDDYCCDISWDSICAGQAQELCLGCPSCGNQFAGDCCSSNGSPFCNDETCCETVCPQDPFCCDTSWDSLCADQANELCEVCQGCGNPFAGDCCSPNDSPYCDDAACCEAVCAQDPFCCTTEWDSLCAEDAFTLCDIGCECAHSFCVTGEALQSFCDPCVGAICAVDPFCCNNSWDGLCVGQVETVCGKADCISPNCAHPVCVTGGALAAGCHPCVGAICAVDPFCCNNSWDGLCVSQVGTVCGLTCP